MRALQKVKKVSIQKKITLKKQQNIHLKTPKKVKNNLQTRGKKLTPQKKNHHKKQQKS